MGAMVERAYPTVLGLLCAAGYLIFLRDEPIPGTAKDLLSAVINLSAISIGFLATVKSVLLSIEDRPSIKWLKNGQSYDQFRAYVFGSIYSSFAVAVISAVCLLFFGPLEAASWSTWFVAAYVALVVATGTGYFRVVTVFSLMLKGTGRKA